MQYGLLWVKRLSYTCKRLNACCVPWVFKAYRLGLPASSPRLSQSKFDAIAARLQNFRDRASYVQDLTLRFGKTNDQDVDDLFPSRAIPDLIDALSCANKLISVQLISGQMGKLSLPLWNWLTTKNLSKFNVGRNLAPPPDAERYVRVTTFEGYPYEGPMQFLNSNLVHPDKIILYHQWGGRPSKLIQSYKPSGPHISHLRNIDLRMSAWDTIIFDFSSVLDATIHAEFYLLRGASTAWKDFKPILRRSFAEGLDGYDVSRHFETVTVFRPSLAEIEVGWKPKNAAHEDDDDENDELSQLYPIGRRVLIRDV